ncbi:retroviral aspartyl protease family protein [Trichonephila clavipes]|nr:retroviral aspartyl protease family protein [Trichonephila clavipes]
MDGLKEGEIQKAVRMTDVQDLKSALLYALKLEAATQASRRDRQSIRAARVTADEPTNCIIPGLVAENRKFRFGLIDYPDPDSLKAGVLTASSVVDLSNSVIPVRIANLSDKLKTNRKERGSSQGILLENTNLDEKQRCAAGGLIKEFQSPSLFSRTSEDFGRTRLTKH